MARTTKKLSGEELFKAKGLKVLFKKSLITVIINGKEHVICSKNKFTKDNSYANYNKEITQAYKDAVKKNLI